MFARTIIQTVLSLAALAGLPGLRAPADPVADGVTLALRQTVTPTLMGFEVKFDPYFYPPFPAGWRLTLRRLDHMHPAFLRVMMEPQRSLTTRWLVLLHCCLTCAVASLGQPAQAVAPPVKAMPAYDIHAPVYPVTYTDAQKDAQREAGRDILRQINDALAAGAHAFTVPPGVYRLPASGNDGLKYVNGDGCLNFRGVRGFTLHLAHTEFVLENGSTFLAPEDASDIAVLGPVVFDADPLHLTQGVVTARDEATGLTTVKIMPGYKVDYAPKGQIDAFSPQGVYLENPSWAGYTDLTVLDRAQGLIQLKAGAKGLYQPGNLVALRDGGPVFLSAGGKGAHNLTLRDIEIDTGVGFAWGGGTGDWNFLNVKGIRRPGTNRLYGAGGCQVHNDGGNVTFDGCEFSNCADDLVDYSGGGLFTCERQESPRTVVTWGGGLSVGDTVNFYTSGGFQQDAAAKVVAVADITDPAIQADARHLIKDILKARDNGDKPLRRVTLDRDVTVSAGDYMENGSANRPDHFTVRNCYFHDAGVRVMIQGFRHGLFENNTFERVSGGLALTCDAWWFEGPTVQDIVVRDNVFRDTAFRDGWGTGKAALAIGAGWAEGHTDPALPCATHGATVTGNTFIGSSTGAIQISNTDHVIVANNVIRRPYALAAPGGAIHLLGVADATVAGNRVWGSPGPCVLAEGSRRLSVRDNVLMDTYRRLPSPVKDVPDAVIGIVNCAQTQVTDNRVDGTDAASAVFVAGSAGTMVRGNTTLHMKTPGAAPVGTGAGNTGLQVAVTP